MPAAGDKVLAADIDNLEDYTIRRPLVRLVQQSAQALADATAVAVTFGASSEDIDTHGFHDTGSNTSRITPTIEGYYQVSGGGFFEAQTTPVVSSANIRKNGSTNMPAAGRAVGMTQGFMLYTSVLVSMNGTTDYVELIMNQDSAGADNTNVSSQFTSTLECKFERPL